MSAQKPRFGTGAMADSGRPDDPAPGARPAASQERLPPAAARALEEAAARRAALDARAAELGKAKEHHGRGGLDPVRYEDWEINGRASDF